MLKRLSTGGKYDGLTETHILAYGVGHVLNDLVAGFGMNFFLYFLVEVVIVDSENSAAWAGFITLMF
jgi:Na+/melibiose symporter-like transporter